MKRDIDLIRKILVAVESLDPSPHNDKNLEIEGYGFDTVAFHLELLEEAGLVKAHIVRDSIGRFAAAWAGT